MKSFVETISSGALESGNPRPSRRRQRVWISICIVLCVLWGLITTNFSTKFSSQRLREIVSRPVHEAEQALIPSPTARTSSWTGWSDVQHLFTFGDSYTATSFDPRGVQPSESNPIGNPAYPGLTTIGTPVWSNYLAAQYNESMVKLYNMAESGATIDNSIVPSKVTNRSFAYQVDDMFAPIYGNQSNGWNASNSLFVVFFGVNDVVLSFEKQNASAYPQPLTASYMESAEKLYSAGARNIMFISTPPIDRAPHPGTKTTTNIPVGDTQVKQILDTEPEAKTPKAEAIEALNAALGAAVDRFNSEHTDTTTWLLDAHQIFNDVLDDPSSSPTTAGITHTTDYCKAYGHSGKVDLYKPECGDSREAYFWTDVLHPASTMHRHLAEKIVEELDGN